MRYVSYEAQGNQSYGVVVEGERIADIPTLLRSQGEVNIPPALLDYIAAGEEFQRQTEALVPGAQLFVPLKEARLLAPIPRPRKNVFCLGLNYADHVAEGQQMHGVPRDVPEIPVFFTKPPTAVIGPDANITVDPKVSDRIDYEVELAVVVGKAGKNIPQERWEEHVFGYTILNDVTARDLQRSHNQWFKGKGLDNSCPLGPWIVTKDELRDPQAINVETRVNGQRRQFANTNTMIFRLPKIIESLSAGLTLEPGDIIATGTPSGVGFAMQPPQFLKPGDTVELEIEGIGSLRNPVAKASA